jgi:hypothetical protein
MLVRQRQLFENRRMLRFFDFFPSFPIFSKMDDIIRPKHLAAKQAAEAEAGAAAAADAAKQEEMIQAYAAYLEEVKASDPAEYKRIVDDMMSAAPDGLKAKMSRGTLWWWWCGVVWGSLGSLGLVWWL